MTLFSTVELAPRDPILGITEQFAADPNPHKVNLGVGMYYDENGRLPLLKCVAAVEQAMVEAPVARGYLPIDGMADYDRAAQRLAFGESSAAVTEQRIATVQGLGGTGALKVAADFLKRLNPQSRVLISDPSWENHRALFTQAGFEVASDALQVMGATGYSQDVLVEYCLRRCRGWMIAGGSVEILKNRIAESIFERTFPQRAG